MTNNIEQIEDHEIIYLEPDYSEEGRCWCLDNVWHESDYGGVNATKYIRYDLYESKIKSMQSQIDALTKEADADESRESESL